MEILKKKCASFLGKGRGIGTFGLIFLSLVFMGTGLLTAGTVFQRAIPSEETKQSFQEALTLVTQKYYEEEFRQGTPSKRKKVCGQIEEALQEYLKQYPGQEEQKRLLLLLALNAELAENTAHARQYYEQLLLYDPGCEEGYEEYGNYLWRMGEWEASLQCYQAYENAKEQGLVGKKDTPNRKLWEERIHWFLSQKEKEEGT